MSISFSVLREARTLTRSLCRNGEHLMNSGLGKKRERATDDEVNPRRNQNQYNTTRGTRQWTKEVDGDE
jgi:hypothetical protein